MLRRYCCRRIQADTLVILLGGNMREARRGIYPERVAVAEPPESPE